MAISKLPIISNVTCASADTEYSFETNQSTRRISIKARDVSGAYPRIRLALTTGIVAGAASGHLTLESGRAINVACNGGSTIYLASATAGGVVEIWEEWLEC